MSKEVMQQALDALNDHPANYKLNPAEIKDVHDAVDALRAALAQPVQPAEQAFVDPCMQAFIHWTKSHGTLDMVLAEEFVIEGEIPVCSNGWSPALFFSAMTEIAWRAWANRGNVQPVQPVQPAINDADIESAARADFNPELNWHDPANLGLSAVSRSYFRSGAKWALSKVAQPVRPKETK